MLLELTNKRSNHTLQLLELNDIDGFLRISRCCISILCNFSHIIIYISIEAPSLSPKFANNQNPLHPLHVKANKSANFIYTSLFNQVQ